MKKKSELSHKTTKAKAKNSISGIYTSPAKLPLEKGEHGISYSFELLLKQKRPRYKRPATRNPHQVYPISNPTSDESFR